MFSGGFGDGGGSVSFGRKPDRRNPHLRFTWIPATSPWKSVVGEVVLQVATVTGLGGLFSWWQITAKRGVGCKLNTHNYLGSGMGAPQGSGGQRSEMVG